jgi:small GTP-binding protein
MTGVTSRVVTLGDSGVGKTALIYCMKNGAFLRDTSPTIGAGITTIEVDVEGAKQALQIWDTAGQELYRNIIPIYFRGAMFGMICFAVNDRQSFQHLDMWLEQLSQHSGPDIGLVLVGTKYDSPDKVVHEDEVKKYAEEHRLHIFFTSSVTGQNVVELLEYIAVAQTQRGKEHETSPIGIELRTDAVQKKKSRC